MVDDRQQIANRMALARRAHDADPIRLVSADIAGFDHVVGCGAGLFAVNADGSRLLLHGQFYGITIAPGAIYAFEQCDLSHATGAHGRILRLHHDGRRIDRVELFARDLPNGCHQIDLIGDDLFVTDTHNQRLLRFALDGSGPDVLRPLPPPDPATNAGYVHVNSLLACGDTRYLLLHQGGAEGIASEIAVFDRYWSRTATRTLAGRACHNIALLEDGSLLACGSISGELIGADGPVARIGDVLVRGLSVDATQVVVGGSELAERSVREQSPGEVHFLDRAYRPIARIDLPGPVMEIRRIDGQDRGLSRHVDRPGQRATDPPHRLRRRLYAARRYLHDGGAWSELATRLVFRDAVHQPNTLSWPDRYPRLFGLAADLLRDLPAPTILSFGCSAGEEVLSLQRRLPRATVVGAEINRRKLRACRRLPADPRRTFIRSTRPDIAASGPYDAIFCMAVLTRHPHQVATNDVSDIAAFYPFRRFLDELVFLVGQLREGGLLVVEHSLYRVEDALDILNLEVVQGPATYVAKGPRFDPAGRRIERPPVVSRLFRKRPSHDRQGSGGPDA